MKKVKVFLTAIIMVVASAIITACSCSETEFTPVYETGISIKCTTRNANVDSSLDEESGEVTIWCHRGDRFTIEYTLTPADATSTQVDWEFTKDGPLSASTFSYSKGVQESVTFTAKGKGETDIVFTTHTTGKKAIAHVTVYEEASKLPTLATPANIHLDISTGAVTWNEITTTGLSGYKAVVQEYKIDSKGSPYKDTDVEVVEVELETNRYDAIEPGKTYGIKLTAIGDGRNAMTGTESAEFIFHQLSEVTIDGVSNGIVSFTTPKYGASGVVACEGTTVTKTFESMSSSLAGQGNESYATECNDFGEDSSEYELSITAYPKSFAIGTDIHKKIGKIYFYPSNAVSVPKITRLSAPELSLANILGDQTIGGKTFNNVIKETKLNLLGKDNYEGGNVTYQYFVLTKNQIDGNESEALNNIGLDVNGESVMVGTDTVTVRKVSDGQMSLSAGNLVQGNLIYVRLVGDEDSTISSVWSKLLYKQLGRVMIDGSAENDVSNVSISSNIVRVVTSDGFVGGVEFYFINSDNPNSSRFVASNDESVNGLECDISKVNLSSGSYSVYARLVGKEGAYTAGEYLGLTGELYDASPLDSLKVLKAPESVKMTSSGTVSFSKTTYTNKDGQSIDIKEYTITLTQKKNDGTDIIYTIPLSADAVWKETKIDDYYVVPLTLSGSKYTFDFFNVIRAVRAMDGTVSPSAVTDDDISALLRDYEVYIVNITANSNGEGEEAIISSQKSVDMRFGRVDGIRDIVLYNSKTLKFANVNANGYVVIINGVTSKVASGTTADYVEIDLSTLRSADNTKTMLDCVDKSSEENIEILIYGIGKDASSDNADGMLDSFKTQTFMELSATPVSLSMTKNGTLSWKANKSSKSNVSYKVQFYVGGTLVNTKVVDYSEGEDGEDDERTYSLNVSEVLAEYEGQVVSMQVVESIPTSFVGNASLRFYAKQLTTVNITRDEIDGKPVLTYKDVEGATGYTITLSNEAMSLVPSIDRTTLDLSGLTTAGTYRFNIVADGTNSADSGQSDTQPFYISSSSTKTGSNEPTMVITVADDKTSVVARGESVVWTYNPDYTYSVAYAVKGSNTWTTVSDDQITTVEGRLEKSFSLASLLHGDYDIKIIASVSYKDTGIILISSNASEYPFVTKVQTIASESMSTSSGEFKLELPEDFNEESSVIEIYNNGQLLDSNQYTISVGAVTTVNFVGISASTLKITIKIKSTGKIDSNMSAEYTATKMASVTEFERDGDYLQWSPVEKATGYRIVVDGGKDGEYEYELKITKDGDNYICVIVKGLGDEETPEAGVFKYENGLLKFKPDNLSAGLHTYKITPITNINSYLNGNANTISVTKLDNGVEVTAGTGGVFAYGYYDKGEGAEPQSVSIKIYRLKNTAESGDPIFVIDDSCDSLDYTVSFSEYSASATEDGGTYTIDIFGKPGYDSNATFGTVIKFIGNGKDIIDSDETSLIEFNKISPVAIKTAEGIITWEASSDEEYEVEITDKDGIVATFNISATSGDIKLPASITDGMDGVSNLFINGVTTGGEESGDVEQGDDGDIELQSEDATFNYVAGKEYYIRVITKKRGNLKSEWSDKFTFKKLLAITDLNFVIKDAGSGKGKPSLEWSDLNDKSKGYNITVGYYSVDDGSALDNFVSLPSNTLYQELSYDIPVGNYYIRMVANGNTSSEYGLLNSDISSVGNNCKVVYMANVTNPTVDNGKVSWDAVTAAYAYQVTFTSKPNENSYSTYTTTNELDLNSASIVEQFKNVSGYYDIKVLALTNPRIAMVSLHKDAESQDTATVYRPAELTSFKVKNGMLSWVISYEEIQTYMSGLNLDEIFGGNDEGSEGGEEEGSGEASEGEEVATYSEDTDVDISLIGDAKNIVPYIIDMATKGESSETIYDKINLQHFYKVRLNVNGVVVTVSASEATILDASDKEADAESGVKIEFRYDVEVKSDGGGAYEFKVGAFGTEAVLNGIDSGSLSAFKLATPTSWYDGVETKVPVVDEFGEQMTDEDGEPLYETKTVYTDIKNGMALWQLTTISDSEGNQTYYKKYTLTALSDEVESRIVSNITVEDDDENIKDEYKYHRDLKGDFYNKDNKVELDKVYRLRLQANGTEDSSKMASGETLYLNSNVYTFSDTMTILGVTKPAVKNGSFSWEASSNSLASKLTIYGPLNYKDANVSGELEESDNWDKKDDTKKMLAKVKYANTGDESVFEEFDSTVAVALKSEVDGNKGAYQALVHNVDLNVSEGSRDTQYSLSDKEYTKGGYVIYEQEIGNGRGIVDSPESEATYAYKLGNTSATRQKTKTYNTVTKSVDYWLGTGDTAGMFTWNAVPLANAYRITLNAVDSTVEDGEKIKLLENYVVRTTYYELDDTKDYGNINYEYSIDIVAIREEDRHAGSEPTANYQMKDNYFASDTVATDKEEEFGEDSSLVIGRYRRLDGPTELQIDDKGKITWNGGSNTTMVYAYYVSYQWGDGVNKNEGNQSSNESNITVLNTILGTTSIRVKAMANSEYEVLNSCYSSDLRVVKIAPPEPTVTNGVFGWGTDGDNLTGQSVTSSNLEIDGSKQELSSTTLEYPFYTEVTINNYESYSKNTDESTFAPGAHTFDIMYNGTSGSSEDGETFYIASEKKAYYVNKLTTPILSHYTGDTNTEEGNKIYWGLNDNASAYKLKFFVEIEGATKVLVYIINVNDRTVTIDNPNWSNPKIESISKGDWNSNKYFNIENENIIFKIDNLFGDDGVGSDNSEKGLSITAFVQAIGTITSSDTNDRTNPAYLNSSYSESVQVSIPSAPTSAEYNPSTGMLTWKLTTPSDAYKNYNVLLTMEYEVENIDEATRTIWTATADKFAVSEDGSFTSASNNENNSLINTRYSDILERIVLWNKDAIDSDSKIFVRDTILVESINGKMPLSYQVKAVATNYKFKLVTTAYKDSEDGVYKSSQYSYPSDSESLGFKLFSAGNGCENLPYEISTEASLKCISLYPNSCFKITNDIALVDGSENGNWALIDEFGGILDGDNHLISNLKPALTADTDAGSTSYMSFIKTNSGTIKNLNFQINYSITNEGNDFLVAGVAINNDGEINNVHILPNYKYKDGGAIDYDATVKSEITVKATCSGVNVGGLVVNNNGSIVGSSVLADITVLLDKTTNGATVPNGYVGGIAQNATNASSKIEDCCFKAETNSEGELFSGSITANYIGGILEKNTYRTTITRCYVDKNVLLTLTDRTSSDTNYKTAGRLGAILGYAGATVTIDTCYSLATIVVDIANASASSNPFPIGGIVGDYGEPSSNLITVSDCYVVARFSLATGSHSAEIKYYPLLVKTSGNKATLSVTKTWYYVDSVTGVDINTECEGYSESKKENLLQLKAGVSSEKYDTTGDYPTIKKSND